MPAAPCSTSSAYAAFAIEEGSNPDEFTGHGTCTYTDTDGDNIFMPYSAKGGRRGTYEVAAGTGKFAGITGTGEWWRLDAAPIRSDDKRARTVISNKVPMKTGNRAGRDPDEG